MCRDNYYYLMKYIDEQGYGKPKNKHVYWIDRLNKYNLSFDRIEWILDDVP
jgi:hypothetical protein